MSYFELDTAGEWNFDDELLVSITFEPFCRVTALVVRFYCMQRCVLCSRVRVGQCALVQNREHKPA